MTSGQQAAAFQINEVCRHHDEFAGKFNIQLFERLKIFEVLASDALERNIVDIDFVLFDQIKQKIETILRRVAAGSIRFSDLFGADVSRIELVVTFLALLELIRLKQVRAIQKNIFEEIEIAAATA